MSEGELKSYWLSAGSTLYYDKQPSAGFIPREGLIFISEEVFKAEDVRSYIAALQRRVEWTTAKPTEHGYYWARWTKEPQLGPEILEIRQPNGPDTDYLEVGMFDESLESYIANYGPVEWQGPLAPHEARG